VKKTFFKILKIAVVVMLVATMGLLSLSACTFIRENEERVATQVLVTIVNPDNGLTLTITQTELFDYFNNFIQQHAAQQGLSMSEALDLTFEMQTKSKYFVTVAAGRLVSDEFPQRADVLVGEGGFGKPNNRTLIGADALVGALTFAEYYSTIFAVNESFRRTVEDFAEEARQTSFARAVSGIDKNNLAEIKFAPSTLRYLNAVAPSRNTDRNEFFVGQEIDMDQIKFVVYRLNEDGVAETDGVEYNVTDGMFTTRFSTASAGTELSMAIRLDERFVNEDGEVSFRERTAEFEFDVVAPRTHLNRVADTPRDLIEAIGASERVERRDTIQFGDDITIWRYASEEVVRHAIGNDVELLNLSAWHTRLDDLQNRTIEQTREMDAVKRVMDNIARGFRTEKTIHNSAVESMITTALQAESRKLVAPTTAEEELKLRADIFEEFRIMFERSRHSFGNMTETEIQAAFFNIIRSNMNNYAFHPNVWHESEDNSILADFFYVYQILIRFPESVSTHADNMVSALTGAEQDAARERWWQWGVDSNLIHTNRSNYNFDPTFECPRCHGSEGTFEGDVFVPATCKWTEKDAKGDYVYDATTRFGANNPNGRYGVRTWFNCPSRPFIQDENGYALDFDGNRIHLVDAHGNYVFEKDDEGNNKLDSNGDPIHVFRKNYEFNWIVNELADRLQNPSNDPFEVFKQFMYEFNDDPGIMNSPLGYLMHNPDIDDLTNFMRAFNILAHDTFNFGRWYRDEVSGRYTNEHGVWLNIDADGNLLEDKVERSDWNPLFNAFVADGQIGYAFTSHGIHIIMVSATPWLNQPAELAFMNQPGALNFNFTVPEGQLLPTGHVEIEAFLRRQINFNNGQETLWNAIELALLNSREERLYADFMTEVIPEDLHEDTAIVTREESRIRRLYRMLNA
jgi:hypothetical protein